MKNIYLLIIFVLLFSCVEKIDLRTVNFPKEIKYADHLPTKENFWIFILAGQSNMAGRGLVEPADTLPLPRVFSLNKDNNWIFAKEPLHFYESSLTGLDCGLSFGKALLPRLNDSIYIGLIPCAVGGSSVEQWLGDSTHRGVQLFSNFKTKTEFAAQSGTIKGILWHQGESDANPEQIKSYGNSLQKLFSRFRKVTSNDSLPILVGRLGPFLSKEEYGSYPDSINSILKKISDLDENVSLIETGDLNHKGDFLHFDSESQRLLGNRFAGETDLK